MRRLRAFAAFVWEFVVGDDWTIALGVVIALGLTAILAEVGLAWLVMPLAVAGLLTLSVWRGARSMPPSIT